MNLLLDTHVLIWWDEGRRLSGAARHAIEAANQVYVSELALVTRDPVFERYAVERIEA